MLFSQEESVVHLFTYDEACGWQLRPEWIYEYPGAVHWEAGRNKLIKILHADLKAELECKERCRREQRRQARRHRHQRRQQRRLKQRQTKQFVRQRVEGQQRKLKEVIFLLECECWWAKQEGDFENVINIKTVLGELERFSLRLEAKSLSQKSAESGQLCRRTKNCSSSQVSWPVGSLTQTSVRRFHLDKTPKLKLNKTPWSTTRPQLPKERRKLWHPQPVIKPPVVDKTESAIKTPIVTKTPVVTKTQSAIKAPVVTKTQSVRKTPVVAKTRSAIKTPVVAKTRSASKTPVVTKTQSAIETPVVAETQSAIKTQPTVRAQLMRGSEPSFITDFDITEWCAELDEILGWDGCNDAVTRPYMTDEEFDKWLVGGDEAVMTDTDVAEEWVDDQEWLDDLTANPDSRMYTDTESPPSSNTAFVIKDIVDNLESKADNKGLAVDDQVGINLLLRAVHGFPPLTRPPPEPPPKPKMCRQC